jgi:L-lactate utilization protein LutC
MMNQQVAYEKKSGNAKRIEQDEKELEAMLNRANEAAKPEEPEETDETPEQETPPQEEAPKEEELSAEEKSFKKRYGDLRKHLEKTKAEYEQRIKQLEERVNKESIVPPKSEEDIEKWVKKYPDVAGIVETIAQKKAEKLVEGFQKKFEEYDQLQEQTARQRAESKIREKHSDFDDLKASNEFHDWANEQPKWVQDALYENENDAASVIRVIDLYKVDKGMDNASKRGKAKEAASAVKGNTKPSLDPDEGSRKIRESDVARMSDVDYEKNEDKILEAMRSGNFVYDLSGGAR